MRSRPNEQAKFLTEIDPSNRKTCLHIVIEELEPDVAFRMVEFLVGKGARVDVKDKLLRTPLHIACTKSYPTIVRFLLEN